MVARIYPSFAFFFFVQFRQTEQINIRIFFSNTIYLWNIYPLFSIVWMYGLTIGLNILTSPKIHT